MIGLVVLQDVEEYVLSKGSSLPESDAQELFQQLVVALAYMHKLGVVGRDVKLENTFISLQQPCVPPPLTALLTHAWMQQQASIRAELRVHLASDHRGRQQVVCVGGNSSCATLRIARVSR